MALCLNKIFQSRDITFKMSQCVVPCWKNTSDLDGHRVRSVRQKGGLGEQRGSVQLFEAEMLKQATEHSNLEQ